MCPATQQTLFVFALAAGVGQAALAPLQVRTTSGVVSGKELGGRYAFLGIPYAAPPVGDLRFRPPQPHPGWQGVLPAVDYGPSCQQYLGGCWATQNASVVSEDCLSVNVLAPPTAAQKKHPVLIYLHAGEFRCGGSNDAESNWLSWASDVVYVSFNYRVGALGFLAADELRDRSPNGGTGNYGLLDQRYLLEWVQENIQAFGGDPTAVTIMGESSGGTSVAYHLTAGGKAPTKLFARAILESPGLTQVKQWEDAMTNTEFTLAALAAASSPKCNHSAGYYNFSHVIVFANPPLRKVPLQTLEDAMRWCDANSICVGFTQMGNQTVFSASSQVFDGENRGVNFTAYMKKGPTAKADRLACLLSADADILTQLTLGVPRDDTFETDAWGPVLDGVDLPEDLEERVHRGELASGVDVLAGYNLDEGTEFMMETPPLKCNATEHQYNSWVSSFLGPGEVTPLAAALYQPASLLRPLPACEDQPRYVPGQPIPPRQKFSGEESGYFNAAMRMAGDKAIRCPTNSLAKMSTGRSFVYQFRWTPSFTENFGDASVMGAFHGAEVPFVFGDTFELKEDAEKRLSSVMGCYWRSFVLHGDPGVENCSTSDSVPWPRYSAATSWALMILGNSSDQLAVASRAERIAEQRCTLFEAAKFPQFVFPAEVDPEEAVAHLRDAAPLTVIV